MSTYFYQHTPPFSCTYTLWKVSDLVYDVFFPHFLKVWTPWNIPSVPHFLLFLYPPRKKIVAPALRKPLFDVLRGYRNETLD